jgi:hypothetical protein
MFCKWKSFIIGIQHNFGHFTTLREPCLGPNHFDILGLTYFRAYFRAIGATSLHNTTAQALHKKELNSFIHSKSSGSNQLHKIGGLESIPNRASSHEYSWVQGNGLGRTRLFGCPMSLTSTPIICGLVVRLGG